VGAYLRETGAFDGDLPEEMTFEQGHFVDRPGRVFVRARGEVRVGGTGVPVFEGDLTVPEDDDDEIIEA
jgi:predicted PhzF superfamily epimerase YddE/YHI9